MSMEPPETKPTTPQISVPTAIWTNLISLLVGAAVVAFSMMISFRHESFQKAVSFKEQPETAVETARLASEYEELIRKTESEKHETDDKVKRATTALDETGFKLEQSKTTLEELNKQFRESQDAIDKLSANIQARPNATPDAKKIADAQQALSKLGEHITRAEATQEDANAQVARVKETLAVPPGAEAAVKVFYATDRKASTGSNTSPRYEGARGDGLRYGICTVSLPKDHRMGQLESPSIFRLEFKPNPEKHIVLQNA